MHASSQCANCGRVIGAPEQKFCPSCGQPTPAHRIDWHFLGHELEHSVLHMDRGIFYSLKNLMLRPGHFIRDYIEGRRANHVKPLMLVMIVAAVVVLLSKLIQDGDIVGPALNAGASIGAEKNATAIAAMLKSIQDWANRHYAAVTLMLLPLEAAALKLGFRRFKLNYPEWLVIAAFLTVQAFVLQVLFILLSNWLQIWRQGFGVVAILYNVFSLVQYFDGYPRWKSTLRAILGMLFYQAAAVLFGAAIAAIWFAIS